MYRLEKTEKLIRMSQCLAVPFQDRGMGREEKTTQEAEDPNGA